ncbi:Cyclin PHO80-like family protein [Pseudohyphozyma bogoriensis]|nr:Cyclin PHO80-like family protein [Pseudohyphozyma bogoriensis]
MNVPPSFRPSAPQQHDVAWSSMQPAYSGFGAPLYGGGLEHYQPQQQQHFSHHPYAAAFAAPFAPLLTNRHQQPAPYFPAFATPPHPSPAVGTGYFGQQQQEHSRHAFAAPYPHQQQPYGYEQAVQPSAYHAHPAHPAHPAHQHQAVGQPAFGGYPMVQHLGGWPVTAVDPAAGIWRHDGAGEPLRFSFAAPRVHDAHPWTRGIADLERPSFDRTTLGSTHASSVAPAAQAQQPQAPAPAPAPAAPAAQEVTYDLISNVSTVPPPPPIEQSAVPLADLATEMVWEACTLGVEAMSSRNSSSSISRFSKTPVKAPALFSEVTESNLRALGGSPRKRRATNTPELFGAIGEGRTRKVSSDGCASDNSSPSSSAPGTPAGVGAIEAVAARKQRLAGLGFGFVGDAKSNDDELRFGSLDSPVSTFRPRRLSDKMRDAPTNAASFPVEPSPAFRQFVKQVLTATLLSPEDLALALYYVARIPLTSIIPPPPADQSHSLSARASAVKAAPFKIILGALMIANKTLQDNSYRNETFATVSGIPLKDVNELEVYVFGALGFDVAVKEDAWRPWLQVVQDRAHNGHGELGNEYDVRLALNRLERTAARNSTVCTGTTTLSPPSSPVACALLDAPSQLRPSPFVLAEPKSISFPTSHSRTSDLYN